MGLLTFTQIKSEIKKHFADRSDITTRLSTVIDLSQMRLARLKDWDQLRFLVQTSFTAAGTAIEDKVYDLSTDLPTGYKIKNLYNIRLISSDGRSHKLVGKTQQEFDELVPEPEWYTRRMPQIYTRVSTIKGGNQVNPGIELWPVPDVEYDAAFRMQVWPRFLSDAGKVDTDTSDLELDDAIISLSVSYIYSSLGREDKAKYYFSIYSAIVSDALKLDETDFETVIAGVNISQGISGDYWLDPFIRGVGE